MKIDARRVAGLLRDPSGLRVVLLYGDDVGLIRDRADALTRAVTGGLDDPFRVALLERESQDRLTEEATALSLTGGRRVVRVREAGDSLVAHMQAVLDSRAEALVVLEGPGLAARSKLRALAERHDAAGAIGCYPEEGRALEATIRAVLAEHQLAIEPDALGWLVGQLGADQALTRQEVEKLALYAAQDGRVELAAAQACVGDAAVVSLDDALFAATRGDLRVADRAVGLALAEGMSPVGLLRAALMHVQRLQRARASMTGDQSAMDAVRQVRPPIFYRREGDFARALDLWDPDGLAETSAALFAAESACKRTGAPMEAIAAHAILAIAARSAQRGAVQRGRG